MAKQSLELTFKRGITAGLGIFGLFILLVPIGDVRDRPSRGSWLALAIHVAGPIVAAIALSLWPRWRHLRPDLRFGTLFVAAFALPVVALTVAGAEQLDERAVVALVVSISFTALWWVLRGQKLDAAGTPEG